MISRLQYGAKKTVLLAVEANRLPFVFILHSKGRPPPSAFFVTLSSRFTLGHIIYIIYFIYFGLLDYYYSEAKSVFCFALSLLCDAEILFGISIFALSSVALSVSVYLRWWFLWGRRQRSLADQSDLINGQIKQASRISATLMALNGSERAREIQMTDRYLMRRQYA